MIENPDFVTILTGIGAILSLIGALISLSSFFKKNHNKKVDM
jgi:hypothetical protein